ncbi:MAG: fumarylacetoacetate hydrolase family protein [Pseudomonadota bacterium]
MTVNQTAFDPHATARAIADAHAARTPYANLTGALAPPTIDDGYAAQEALAEIWRAEKGDVAGLKIATTTKVMQELMGIDHPCGGMIYADTIHPSGVAIRLADFMHVVVECELAVRIDRDLPDTGALYTAETVRDAVGTVAAAFELIEDRGAVYRESDAKTILADNAWNGGIVLGKEVALPKERNLDGQRGSALIDGNPKGDGLTDNPMGALAWVANLAVSRGRPMTKGMIVITGSVIPTFAVEAGTEVVFEIDNIGRVSATFA